MFINQYHVYKGILPPKELHDYMTLQKHQTFYIGFDKELAEKAKIENNAYLEINEIEINILK